MSNNNSNDFNVYDVKILLNQMYKIRDKYKDGISSKITKGELAYDLGICNGISVAMLEFMRDELKGGRRYGFATKNQRSNTRQSTQRV